MVMRTNVIVQQRKLKNKKKRARQKKLPYIYNRKWRDIPESDAPKDIKPVIRFKSKTRGINNTKRFGSR
jgi:glutamyl-tRNA synthetase